MFAKVLILLVVCLVHHSTSKSSTDSGFYKQYQPFVCERPGNFENPTDVSCKTFYQCSAASGTPIPFTCPIATNFDPDLQTCSLTYACPTHYRKRTSKTSTLVTRSLSGEYPVDQEMEVIKSCSPFKCTSEGIFEDPDTCGKYYVCNKFFGTYVKNHSPCPLFAGFDPTYKMCSFAKICFPLMDQCTPQVVQSEEEACTYVGYPEYFHCTRAGLFRNLNDVSCNTYHHCKYTEAGTLIKETYQCLGSSKFNPHAKKCDRNYQCPCNGTAAAGNTENQLAINNQLDQDTNGTVATKEYDDVYERNDSLYMLSAMRDNMLQFSDDKSAMKKLQSTLIVTGKGDLRISTI
ncbi:unnamed protein product [Acanthoscelides obtectus]|uniref:Chitin-binding type-2 domain-containing protein n=1 Tax=Acanthoscelides obtectus TaxID=200917 RepID=A0A9P0LCJ6_ACAOB|nr:unnamed protein product [Acanthoscelides obtectus]CAK1671124.1 hypothetical protein AOBTE_LOCUS28071 [Acanthoscelides obtectus]